MLQRLIHLLSVVAVGGVAQDEDEHQLPGASRSCTRRILPQVARSPQYPSPVAANCDASAVGDCSELHPSLAFLPWGAACSVACPCLQVRTLAREGPKAAAVQRVRLSLSAGEMVEGLSESVVSETDGRPPTATTGAV